MLSVSERKGSAEVPQCENTNCRRTPGSLSECEAEDNCDFSNHNWLKCILLVIVCKMMPFSWKIGGHPLLPSALHRHDACGSQVSCCLCVHQLCFSKGDLLSSLQFSPLAHGGHVTGLRGAGLWDFVLSPGLRAGGNEGDFFFSCL